MTAGRLRLRAGKRGAWNPRLLSPSVLSAWWAADDHGTANMTDDGGGLISNWIDRIGGLAVTAATTARPTWASNSFNSAYAGLTFDGANNCFVTTTLTSIPTGAAAGEIWAVGLQSAAQATIICAYGATTSGQYRRIGGSLTFIPNVSDGTSTNSGTNLAMTSSPFILAGRMFGTTANLWENGLPSVNNPTTIGSLNTGTARLRIGASDTASANSLFGGVLADVLILTGTLADADRQRMEGFFAWKYGLQASLPASHPYSRFAP